MNEYKYIGKEMILDVIKARGRYLGDAEIMNSMDKTALDQIEGYKRALDSIAEDVENIPPVNVQPMKWISCKDKMPDDGVNVLIYAGNRMISLAWYDKDMGYFYICDSDYKYSSLDVTHWQPLPEPPKDGDIE